MELAKVITAELVQQRIAGGVYVEFMSIDNVKQDDYFKIKIGELEYAFQTMGIKVEGEYLKISALEVGYYAHKIERKGVDLRTVIGCDIIPIIDELEKEGVRIRSQWC